MWALFSHKPKVSSLKASYNPKRHHYHHHHHPHCYHPIHHRHYYLFIPLKYFCIVIIIIVEIPIFLSCPGPEPDQKAPATRTRCQVLPGSLSSQDREQEGRGQSVLYVWRTSLLVISTDTSDTCTGSNICNTDYASQWNILSSSLSCKPKLWTLPSFQFTLSWCLRVFLSRITLFNCVLHQSRKS